MRNARLALWIIVLFFGATYTGSAFAQAASQGGGYPVRPIRFVVPFTPGGSTDIVARVMAQKLSEVLGRQIVIDNRAGAAGNIAMELVAKSTPDGYTLVMGHIGTLCVNPSLYRKLPYDPVKDFAPISLVALVPNMLVVHPSLPPKSVPELIAYTKARPGQLNYGSTGPGGTPHLSVEYFKMMAGVDIVQIPYKGAAPMVTDLIGGQLSLTITGIPALLPHARTGKLRALAVTAARRLALLPELPTIGEAALPGYEAVGWYGVLAPAGTAREIVAKLNASIAASVRHHDTSERLAAEGAEPAANTPEEFSAFIGSEMARWSKVIKAAGIAAE
jgi:tripartite-type tricarboxylate transporter receptor subunit TctC